MSAKPSFGPGWRAHVLPPRCRGIAEVRPPRRPVVAALAVDVGVHLRRPCHGLSLGTSQRRLASNRYMRTPLGFRPSPSPGEIDRRAPPGDVEGDPARPSAGRMRTETPGLGPWRAGVTRPRAAPRHRAVADDEPRRAGRRGGAGSGRTRPRGRWRAGRSARPGAGAGTGSCRGARARTRSPTARQDHGQEGVEPGGPAGGTGQRSRTMTAKATG